MNKRYLVALYLLLCLSMQATYACDCNMSEIKKSLENITTQNIHAIRMTFTLTKRSYHDKKEWAALITKAKTYAQHLHQDDVPANEILAASSTLYEQAKEFDWVEGHVAIEFPTKCGTLCELKETEPQEQLDASEAQSIEIMFEIKRDETEYNQDIWQQIMEHSAACAQRFSENTPDTFDDVLTCMQEVYTLANHPWAQATSQILLHAQ